MPDLSDTLDQLAQRGESGRVNLCPVPSGDGYQASFDVGGSWRVRIEPTPSAALLAVLSAGRAPALPPPPY